MDAVKLEISRVLLCRSTGGGGEVFCFVFGDRKLKRGARLFKTRNLMPGGVFFRLAPFSRRRKTCLKNMYGG